MWRAVQHAAKNNSPETWEPWVSIGGKEGKWVLAVWCWKMALPLWACFLSVSSWSNKNSHNSQVYPTVLQWGSKVRNMGSPLGPLYKAVALFSGPVFPACFTHAKKSHWQVRSLTELHLDFPDPSFEYHRKYDWLFRGEGSYTLKVSKTSQHMHHALFS